MHQLRLWKQIGLLAEFLDLLHCQVDLDLVFVHELSQCLTELLSDLQQHRDVKVAVFLAASCRSEERAL